MPKFITPVDVSHAVDGVWTGIDASVHLGADAGNVESVLLQIHNVPSSGSRQWGVRRNGVSVPDDIKPFLFDEQIAHIAVGVDGNDIFECYLSDASNVQVWLLGYVLIGEGTWFDNWVDKTSVFTAGGDDSWYDMDISADTGGDTAITAFSAHYNTDTGNEEWGVRKNGSADATFGEMGTLNIQGGVAAVDGSEIYEMYVGDASEASHYVTGYLTTGWTEISTVDKVPTEDGTWRSVDVSAEVPAGATGAVVRILTAAKRYVGLRPEGGSTETKGDLFLLTFGFVQLDGDRKFEAYAEASGAAFDVMSYFTELAAAGGSLPPLPMNHRRFRTQLTM